MSRLLPIVLNQGLVLLTGILGLLLVSHYVPKEVYGLYGLFVTLTQVGLLLTHSGLINHASRNWQRERPRAGAYLRFLAKMTVRQGGILAVLLIAICLGMVLMDRGLIWLELFPLLFLGNFGVALLSISSLVLNAGERHWAMLVLNGLASMSRSFLPILAAVTIGASVFFLSAGFAVHAFVVAGIVVWLFRDTPSGTLVDPEVRTQWCRELRDFGRPFVWMGAGGWLLQNADRWIVAFYFGKEQAGLFNLASGVAGIIPQFACAALMQWGFPAVFRQADSARTVDDWQRIARQCDRFTWMFLVLTMAGLGALHIAGPWLVGWLVSANYGPSMSLVVPAGMGAMALQSNQFQYLLLQGQHNSSGMVKIMLCLAAIRTIGSLLAGYFSWPVFLGWLLVSTVVVVWLGRTLIQRSALAERAVSRSNALVNT